MKTRLLIAALAAFAMLCASAQAQIIAPGHVIGNGTSASHTATDAPLSGVMDNAFCTTQGDVLQRGASVWGCVTPYSAFGSQSANTVFAAPNGASGMPSFRALVGADLPLVGVTNGGTGAASWTAALPLLGNGTSAFSQGTLTGNTTKFATSAGGLTPGDCAKWDSLGNVVDAGVACGAGGGASTPVYQIFTSPGAVTTLTLTNTPLPTSAGTVSIAFDGRLQARSTWSINTTTDVITFTNAIPANTGVVEVDWWAPTTLAGVSSIVAGSSTITGSVTLVAGSNITLTPSGQNITVGAASVSNSTMMVNDSGSSAAPSAAAPASFWDSFCGNTVGYIWARMTEGWACGSAFRAPVTWWGAACNGSTDDTAAFNAASSSGIKHLIVPGTCNVTTLNQFPSGFTLEGENWNSSCVQTTSASGNVITVSSGDEISNLCMSSAVTRTSGDMIKIGASGVAVSNVGIHRLYISTPFYNAIEICDGYELRLTDLMLYGSGGSTHDGILADCASGSAQAWNTDIIITGAVVTGANNAALEATAEGDMSVVRLQAYANGNGIILDPNGAQSSGNIIQWFVCTACLLDSNSQDGLSENATNGAVIWTTKLVDSWIASNGLWGIGLQTDSGNGSSISATDIVDDTIGANAYYGVVIDDNSTVYNTNITGDKIAGNGVGHSGGGIYLGSGAAAFDIGYNRIGASANFGNNNNSIHCGGVGATLSQSIISNNDMTGNSSTCSGFTFSISTPNINFP